MCHPLWMCAGAGVQAPWIRVLAWCLVGTELVVSEALCWELKASAVVLFLSQVSPKQYPSRKAALEVTLLEVLLDLVDRYWSGCKSLHGNEAFLGELGGTVSWSALAALCQQVFVLPLGSGPRSGLDPASPRRGGR